MTPEIHPIEFYPLKDLQLIGKVCLPKGVNRTKLEQHLNDSDFFDVFGMDRQAFYCKPQWKQLELKKKANLF
jgi:villin 1